MIYIVDDDASICKAVTRLMNSAGLPVQAFPSAEAFLGAVEPTASDCLLLDVHMPGMSGIELQRQLKHSGVPVPVIFITAFDDDDAREQASRAGAAGYFRKPFDDQALLDAIYFATSPTGSHQHSKL